MIKSVNVEDFLKGLDETTKFLLRAENLASAEFHKSNLLELCRYINYKYTNKILLFRESMWYEYRSFGAIGQDCKDKLLVGDELDDEPHWSLSEFPDYFETLKANINTLFTYNISFTTHSEIDSIADLKNALLAPLIAHCFLDKNIAAILLFINRISDAMLEYSLVVFSFAPLDNLQVNQLLIILKQNATIWYHSALPVERWFTMLYDHIFKNGYVMSGQSITLSLSCVPTTISLDSFDTDKRTLHEDINELFDHGLDGSLEEFINNSFWSESLFSLFYPKLKYPVKCPYHTLYIDRPLFFDEGTALKKTMETKGVSKM